MAQVSLGKILTYSISYITVAIAGHFFVRLVLRRYRLEEKRGLEGAGTAIGILERILILTFVLMGQYTALALVLTAKSVARFEELKKRKFAEYYLIGTLSSVLFAMFVGIFTSWLLGCYELCW